MKSRRNVIRIDHKKTHGWQVRIMADGKEYSKFFSDKKYGGQKQALSKATAHRDNMLEHLEPKMKKKPSSYDTRFLYEDARNKSTGVVGVTRYMDVQKSGNAYPYYQTTIHLEKGKAITRSRSIQKHGEESAFLQICEIRREKMKQIYGDRFDDLKFMLSVARHLVKIHKQQVTDEGTKNRFSDRKAG